MPKAKLIALLAGALALSAVACGGQAEPTPDIEATVHAAVAAAMPTATPTAVPTPTETTLVELFWTAAEIFGEMDRDTPYEQARDELVDLLTDFYFEGLFELESLMGFDPAQVWPYCLSFTLFKLEMVDLRFAESVEEAAVYLDRVMTIVNAQEQEAQDARVPKSTGRPNPSIFESGPLCLETDNRFRALRGWEPREEQ